MTAGRLSLSAGVAATLLMLSVVSCGDAPIAPGVNVQTLEITQNYIILREGEGAELSAVARDSAGNVVETPISWVSRKPGNVTVSAAGELLAVKGPHDSECCLKADMSLYVVASAGDQRDSVRILVYHNVAELVIQGSREFTVLQGGKLPHGFIVRDSLGYQFLEPPIEFTARNPALLSYTNNELVTNPNATGSTYLVVSVLGLSDSILVHVLSDTYVYPETSVVVADVKRNLILRRFRSTGVTTLTGASWTTTNAAVATVDADGSITAHATGEAIIKASLDGQTFEGFVRVMEYPAPLRFTSVSVGSGVTCAIATTGDAYCWGSNRWGALGTDALMDQCEEISHEGHFGYRRRRYTCSAIPRRVESEAKFVEVEGTCGLTTTQRVICWDGQLPTVGSPPTELPGPDFRTISGSCGIGTDGLGYCWSAASSGYSVTPVGSTLQWSRIASGGGVTCALDLTGAPYCWGREPARGVSGNTDAPMPVAVDPRFSSVRFTEISASGGTQCAISTDKKVYCWGGDNATNGRVVSLRPAAQAPAKEFVSVKGECALTADGAVYCVSRGGPSVSDDDFFTLVPMNVGVPLRTITRSFFTSCGIGSDELAYCWGDNAFGPQLGDGSSVDYRSVPAAAPVRVAGQQ